MEPLPGLATITVELRYAVWIRKLTASGDLLTLGVVLSEMVDRSSRRREFY